MPANPNFDAIASTTLDNYRDKLVDNIFTAVPFLEVLRVKGQVKDTGGKRIVQPLLYGKNETIDWMSKYDIISTVAQEGISAAEYPWAHLGGSIVVSNIDIDVENSGEQEIIDLLKAKVRQAELSMIDKIYLQLWSARTNAKQMWGIVDAVRAGDPANVATVGNYGNIDRDTYTFWGSQAYNVNGTLTIDAVNHVYNNVLDGTDAPDLIIMDQDIFEKFESLLMQNVRYVDERLVKSGIEHFKHKNAIVVLDKNTAAAPGTSNKTFWVLNTKYIEFVQHKTRNIKITPFTEPENQDVRVAKILWSGNLALSNCKKQGYGYGATKA